MQLLREKTGLIINIMNQRPTQQGIFVSYLGSQSYYIKEELGTACLSSRYEGMIT